MKVYGLRCRKRRLEAWHPGFQVTKRLESSFLQMEMSLRMTCTLVCLAGFGVGTFLAGVVMRAYKSLGRERQEDQEFKTNQGYLNRSQ